MLGPVQSKIERTTVRVCRSICIVSSSTIFSSASRGISRGKTRVIDSSARSFGRNDNSAALVVKYPWTRGKSPAARESPGARRPREIPFRIPGDAREPREGSSIFRTRRRPIDGPGVRTRRAAQRVTSRRGVARFCLTRLDSARFNSARLGLGLGSARLDSTWLGSAWFRSAWLGSAWTPLRSTHRGHGGHISRTYANRKDGRTREGRSRGNSRLGGLAADCARAEENYERATFLSVPLLSSSSSSSPPSTTSWSPSRDHRLLHHDRRLLTRVHRPRESSPSSQATALSAQLNARDREDPLLQNERLQHRRRGLAGRGGPDLLSRWRGRAMFPSGRQRVLQQTHPEDRHPAAAQA